MSGGSYDYLYLHVPELGGHRGQLEAMAERLEELPYAADAAAATRRILAAMNNEALANVWRAVEWWDSGDYGEDQVREALAAGAHSRDAPGRPQGWPPVTADPLVFLHDAMDAAQRDAEAAAERAWSPHWEYDGLVHEIRDLNNGNTLATMHFDEIGKHVEATNPAAVLRRIAADRKILDDCEGILDGWYYGETKELARDTIKNLAEGYGWTETT